MREEEDTSTGSDLENTLNTLKRFQKRIANMDDQNLEIIGVFFLSPRGRLFSSYSISYSVG